MSADNLPPEFDPAFYAETNSDLASFGPAALHDHWRRHGMAEGRPGSPATTREGFLRTVIGVSRGRKLEIGPFCSPLLRGADVAYLDVLDAPALRARATEIGIDPAGCPERIDYVGDIEQIDERFDLVVSSHAIEHQPDPIHHLRSVARLLRKRGRYCLIVPDKRYCFDHFIPESTVAGVLQAHAERRRVHTLQSVVEHRALVTHNNGQRHWDGDHGAVSIEAQAAAVRAATAEHAASNGHYVDVHAWYWTPETFRAVTATLHALGLIELYPARVYSTPRPRFEFCAVLEKRPLTPAPGTARSRSRGRTRRRPRRA